jgi:hypothetical protein
MALTFWAESYFRSLKRTKVLSLLTKYLLQYKRVSIPHIGSFELVQEPPQWRVADQLFEPPSFTTAYLKPDEVPEHQSRFFLLRATEEQLDLASFGRQLRHRLRKGPIQWKGFGILRDASNEIIFEPQPLALPALQPVPARKIIRQDATHSVLVGDTQVNRQAHEETVVVRKTSRSWQIILAWILLVLCLAAIIALLYEGDFSPSAAGLRLWDGSRFFSSV